MKKSALRFISTVVMTLTPAVSFSETPGKIFLIQGKHSQFGPYEGRSWLHGEEIQRNVRFLNYQIDGKKLEVMWTGTTNPAGNSMKAVFPLKTSHVLTSIDNFKPDKDAFSSPTLIQMDLKDFASIRSTIPQEGSIEEKWKYDSESTIPLWVNQRRVEDATGTYETTFSSIGRKLGLDKVVDWYRDQKELDPWRNREEFNQKRQYKIVDHSDYEFYSSNPDILRITNMWVNPLSIAESQSRRNAFTFSLKQKEESFTRDMQKWNLNEAGLLEFGIRDQNGQKIGSEHNNDAALWTGVFAWSQYLKYQQTKDPEALALLKKCISGIATLIDISDRPGEFARTLQVSPATVPVTDRWVQGQGIYSHLKWKMGGNNDMLKGVLLTLTLAKDVLDPNADRALIEKIGRVLRKLPETKTVKDKGDSRGIVYGLQALWFHDEKQIEKYTDLVDSFYKDLVSLVGGDIAFYWNGISDWSGGHLTSVSKVIVIYLSQSLMQEFKSSPKKLDSLQSALNRAQKALAKMPKIYGGFRRPFIDAITYLLVPEARKDESLKAYLKLDQWALREIPYPRSIGNAYADLSIHSHWSMSAWPSLPWKGLKAPFVLKDDLNFDQFGQGAYSYPLYEGPAWTSDYLWKDNPFPRRFHSNSSIVALSSDYLILYWTLNASDSL